jgi:hypothetical protein
MHYTPGMLPKVPLTPKELEVLALAKEANEPWFDIMVKAANIQAERRKKYSGDGDPYTNFLIVANLFRMKYPEIKDEDVFYFYQCLKFARIIVGEGDFTDESREDTLIDLGNYSFLEAGFRCRNLTSNAPERDTQMKFQWRNAFPAP